MSFPVNSVVSARLGVVTDEDIKARLFFEFGSTSGVHSRRPPTATKFPSFRFILAMMRNVSAGLLYWPVILKMALSIQLHDAHLMTSTSASALLNWQLQKWPAPELQHSVRKVRFSIALATAPEQNITILSNSTSHSQEVWYYVEDNIRPGILYWCLYKFAEPCAQG